ARAAPPATAEECPSAAILAAGPARSRTDRSRARRARQREAARESPGRFRRRDRTPAHARSRPAAYDAGQQTQTVFTDGACVSVCETRLGSATARVSSSFCSITFTQQQFWRLPCFSLRKRQVVARVCRLAASADVPSRRIKRPALHVNREGLVRFRLIRVVLAAMLLASFDGALGQLHAQGLTGQISGTVTDASAGVLPGVTVTIRNAGSIASRVR